MNDSSETKITDELTVLASKLPAGVSPDRDLWPGIEQAIAHPATRQRTFWNSAWAQAAAVVLLVAGSSGVTYIAMTDDGRQAPEIIYASNVFESVSGDFGQQYTLGNEYLDAHRQLQSDLEVKLDALPADTREDVVNNLNTIRVAIKDINKALKLEPENIFLQELLLGTYHDEMSLMKQVDSIANAAMRRDDI